MSPCPTGNIITVTETCQVVVGQTETQVVEVVTAGPQGPPGPTGPPGSTTLAALTDVDVTQKTEASVLYYKTTAGKFVADDINTLTTLTDGGNF